MDYVLQVKDLSLTIWNSIAVDKISFDIGKSEIVGIVGESGCGKSLTSLSIMGLFASNVNVSNGSIIFNGNDLLKMSKSERREIYGRDISMIFQEPMTSLNPLIKIGKQVAEPLKLHHELSKKQMEALSENALEKVGLIDVKRIMDSYPFELSGGMQQRVMIAMATVCNPQVLIADEPTTALDVTTQSHVLDLLKKINKENNTSILFISHDVGVIRQICDRIIVMYSGQIVEQGRTEDILNNPLHEYTKGLLASIPTRKRKGSLLECIPGKVPSITEKRLPCQFAPRCSKATILCFAQACDVETFENDHVVRCYEAKNNYGDCHAK